MEDVVQSTPRLRRDTPERAHARELVSSARLDTDSDISAEDILTALLSAAKVDQTPPRKLFMGFDWQSWVGWFFKGAIVVAVFLVTWYRTVNAELQDKASHDDVKEYVHGAFIEHEKHGTHPRLTQKLMENTEAIQAVRDGQMAQKTTDAVQTTILKDIKDDIAILRKRKR